MRIEKVPFHIYFACLFPIRHFASFHFVSTTFVTTSFQPCPRSMLLIPTPYQTKDFSCHISLVVAFPRSQFYQHFTSRFFADIISSKILQNRTLSREKLDKRLCNEKVSSKMLMKLTTRVNELHTYVITHIYAQLHELLSA